MTDHILEPILHQKTFRELTTDELYELLRVRSEVFVVEQNSVYQDMDAMTRSPSTCGYRPAAIPFS